MSETGMGMLAGLAWGAANNDVEFAKERARLKRLLEEANEKALAGQAQSDAARAVLGAVVAELDAEASGSTKMRRLSDPDNVRARNADFADTADAQLQRLSGGELQFNRTSLARIKNTSEEVADSLRKPAMVPRVERVKK